MTENEYLCATNRVKVSAALVIMRDVLPGPGWGISEQDHQKIIGLLRDAEINLFASFELETTEK